jgi:hypothetical protein
MAGAFLVFHRRLTQVMEAEDGEVSGQLLEPTLPLHARLTKAFETLAQEAYKCQSPSTDVTVAGQCHTLSSRIHSVARKFMCRGCLLGATSRVG